MWCWNFATLKYDVCNILLNGDAAVNRHRIQKSTLKDRAVRFESVSSLLDIPFGDVTREHYFGAIFKQPPRLLYMDDVIFLSKTIVYHDKNNKSMGPDDSVNMVMELSQNDNQNKCEDNYDYLVHRKKIDGVKRDSRVVAL